MVGGKLNHSSHTQLALFCACPWTLQFNGLRIWPWGSTWHPLSAKVGT
jgi:hypothetical protein